MTLHLKKGHARLKKLYSKLMYQLAIDIKDIAVCLAWKVFHSDNKLHFFCWEKLASSLCKETKIENNQISKSEKWTSHLLSLQIWCHSICIYSPFNSYFLPVLAGQLAQLTYRKQPNMKEQPQKPKHEHDWAAQIGT